MRKAASTDGFFLRQYPLFTAKKDDEREKERYFQYTFYLVLRMISSYTIFIEKNRAKEE